MATRVPVGTGDDFNRAGTALGANWTRTTTTGGDVLIQATTNIRVYGSANFTGGDGPTVYWNADVFTSDQYSSIVIVSFPNFSQSYCVGVCVGASGTAATRNSYKATVHTAGAGPNYTTRVSKTVAGVSSDLVVATNVPWTASDRIELEREGTTLRLCKNGVPLGAGGFTYTTGSTFTITDTSLTGGNPGITMGGDSSGGGPWGDDWIGGNLVADVGYVPRYYSQSGIAVHRAATY